MYRFFYIITSPRAIRGAQREKAPVAKETKKEGRHERQTCRSRLRIEAGTAIRSSQKGEIF